MRSDTIECGISLGILLALAVLIGGGYMVDVSNNEAREVKRKAGHWMPTKASAVIDVGNGWQEFTYKNQRFLYHHKAWGESGFESIVKIDMKIAVEDE